jgi:hypothetical protein
MGEKASFDQTLEFSKLLLSHKENTSEHDKEALPKSSLK